ncbi:MAG: lipopolysaccharide biosynthesis protein [Desulfobacteraceae bacterium]|nr:lipopolysaccharide biosynthesis protein [Desulfobacteraceae bacterium]
MSLKSKVIKNTSISAISNSVSMLFGFILLPFVIHRMGADAYGLVGFARTFSVTGAAGMFDLGVKQTVVKFVAQYKAQNNQRDLNALLATAFLIMLALAVLLSGIGIWLSGYLSRHLAVPQDHQSWFQLALIVTFLTYLFEFPGLVFDGALQGLQRFDHLKSMDVLRTAGQTLATMALVACDRGFFSLVLISSIFSVFQVSAYAFLTYKNLPGFKIRAVRLSKSSLQDILKFNKHLISAQISSFLGNHAEKVLITLLMPPTFMTMYEVLIKLPRFIRSSLSFMGAAILPAASEASVSADGQRERKLFEVGLRFNLMVLGPVLGCAIVMAPEFIQLWVGDAYLSLVPMLRVMLAINLINPYAGYGWTLLLGMNRRVHYIPIMQWITTCFKIIIVAFLMPKFQFWAIVLAYGAFVLMLPVSLTVFSYEFHIKLRTLATDFLKIAGIAFAPGLLVMTCHDSLSQLTMTHLIIGGIIWGVFSWALYFRFILDGSGRNILKQILPRFASKTT